MCDKTALRSFYKSIKGSLNAKKKKELEKVFIMTGSVVTVLLLCNCFIIVPDHFNLQEVDCILAIKDIPMLSKNKKKKQNTTGNLLLQMCHLL